MKIETLRISEQLRAAKALIDTPDKWCQGAYASSDSGLPVGPDSPLACKFCALGAIRKANGFTDDANKPTAFLSEIVGNVHLWNDGGTHQRLMNGFDKAISLAQGQEK